MTLKSGPQTPDNTQIKLPCLKTLLNNLLNLFCSKLPLQEMTFLKLLITSLNISSILDSCKRTTWHYIWLKMCFTNGKDTAIPKILVYVRYWVHKNNTSDECMWFTRSLCNNNNNSSIKLNNNNNNNNNCSYIFTIKNNANDGITIKFGHIK